MARVARLTCDGGMGTRATARWTPCRRNMTVKTEQDVVKRLNPMRLRDICWELGASFPPRLSGNRIVLAASHPRLGYASWAVEQGSINALQARLGGRFEGARYVIRMYDITDVVFNGLNAHSFFDVGIAGLSGRYYVPIPQGDRNLMAEIGFVLHDGSFHALTRSLPRWFDRDRPTNNFQLGGLFVSSNFRHVVPVESVLDASIFVKLNAELKTIASAGRLRVAALDAGLGADLSGLVRRLGGELAKLDADVTVLAEDTHPGALG